VSARPSARWNPLRCTGTALPPHLLLVAKLLVLSLALNGYVQGLPERWLPMWSIFDALPEQSVNAGMKVLFSAAGIALFFNQWVRAASFLAGLVFFFEPIVCRTHFFYADFFCALVLMLIGLHQSALGTSLVRWQFSVMYFGAALNKVLDPDWRNGVFMQNWLPQYSPSYLQLSQQLPDLWLASFFCWSTILIEFAAAFMLLRRNLWRYTVPLVIVFHATSVFFVGNTFGVFLSALLAAYPVFATWYESGEVEVEHNPGKRTHALLKRLSDLLDRDRLFVWKSGERLRVGAGDECWIGFAAFRRWVLLMPALYMLFVGLIASPKTVAKLEQYFTPEMVPLHWKLAKSGLILLALFLLPLPGWNPTRRAQCAPRDVPAPASRAGPYQRAPIERAIIQPATKQPPPIARP
jgi:hypothetical protein